MPRLHDVLQRYGKFVIALFRAFLRITPKRNGLAFYRGIFFLSGAFVTDPATGFAPTVEPVGSLVVLEKQGKFLGFFTPKARFAAHARNFSL